MAATTTNIGLQFPAKKLCNPNNKVQNLKLPIYSSHKTNTLRYKPKFSLVEASSHGTPNRVDTIDATNESPETALATVLRGRFVEGKFVYRQIFGIRSYEIGPDKTVTMETLMNFLQETALNHVPSLGIGGPEDEFGVTHEMSLRKLIWVATRMLVQVERYSKWGDEIEVDTWFDAAGKNGMRRDWLVRDHHTKEIIARATSTWALMNRETRRLSKLPEEVKQEGAPFNFNRLAIAIAEADSEKVYKLTDDTAERIRSGLAPRWSDMDANLHVNNVKYIGWILESVPQEVLEDYNMTSITLEFRRECMQSNLLESMTSPTERVIGACNNDSSRKPRLQFTHLLRLKNDKAELVRARTQWHLKQKHE